MTFDVSSALVVTFETDLTGSDTQFNIVPEVDLDPVPLLTSFDP